MDRHRGYRRRRPVITGRMLIRALKRDSWVVDRTNGSHVVMKHPVRRTLVVVPCHPGRDLAPGIAIDIIERAGYTVVELRELL